MEGSHGFPTEQELRKLDLTELATQSRSAWDEVKNSIPAEVRQRIEPNFNVLTDSGYIKEQMAVSAR